MRTNHSPMDVAEAIRDDIIKVRRISLSAAARSIGKSPNNLYNILSGKTRLSRATASLLHQTFGYSIDFMTTGEGELYSFEKAIRDVSEDEAKAEWTKEEGEFDAIYYMDNVEDLTPREAVLNHFARALAIIKEKTQQLIPGSINVGRGFEFMGVVEKEFTPATKKEEYLMNTILSKYADIRELIDLDRVLNEVKEIG